MRVGERLILLDGAGNAWKSIIEQIGRAETRARLERLASLPPEPPIALTIGQALGKGDKFEQVVQHGTEVGGSVFLPLHTERGVVEIAPEKVADKRARWQMIAKGAAEQAGRLRIPQVLAPARFLEWARNAPQNMPILLLHPDADALPLHKALIRWPLPPPQLTLLIGPEGGWSPREVSAAKAANSIPITLGPRILRTETAALVAISQILYHYAFRHP